MVCVMIVIFVMLIIHTFALSSLLKYQKKKERRNKFLFLFLFWKRIKRILSTKQQKKKHFSHSFVRANFSDRKNERIFLVFFSWLCIDDDDDDEWWSYWWWLTLVWWWQLLDDDDNDDIGDDDDDDDDDNDEWLWLIKMFCELWVLLTELWMMTVGFDDVLDFNGNDDDDDNADADADADDNDVGNDDGLDVYVWWSWWFKPNQIQLWGIATFHGTF